MRRAIPVFARCESGDPGLRKKNSIYAPIIPLPRHFLAADTGMFGQKKAREGYAIGA